MNENVKCTLCFTAFNTSFHGTLCLGQEDGRLSPSMIGKITRKSSAYVDLIAPTLGEEASGASTPPGEQQQETTRRRSSRFSRGRKG